MNVLCPKTWSSLPVKLRSFWSGYSLTCMFSTAHSLTTDDEDTGVAATAMMRVQLQGGKTLSAFKSKINLLLRRLTEAVQPPCQ